MTDLGTDSRIDIPVIAAEAFGVLNTAPPDRPLLVPPPNLLAGRCLPRHGGHAAARQTRGERPIGRKIGFTNRTTWPDYAPMWGYVYDRTVHDLAGLGGTFSLAGLAEPRIEPEIGFRLAATPTPGMDERALLGCIDGVAHGFEIVRSNFPGWGFTAPDAVAAFGLHGALLLGPWHPVTRMRRRGSRRCRASPSTCCATGRLLTGGTRPMSWGDRSGPAPSGRAIGAGFGQSAPRRWRDRHDGHANARPSGRSWRDVDDRVDRPRPRRISRSEFTWGSRASVTCG